MLNDFEYEFYYKGKDFFEKEVEKIGRDGSCSIEPIIIYFYKDNNNIKSFIRKNNTDIRNMDFDDMGIVSKYYIKKLSYDFEPYAGSEYDTIISIYNIGDFEIIADYVNKKENIESKKLFEEYDKNYSKMKVPFTDDEFLENNYKVLVRKYE